MIGQTNPFNPGTDEYAWWQKTNNQYDAAAMISENETKVSLTPPVFETPGMRLSPLFGGIGFAAGVIYAFANKTGFWKGWGIAIVGSIALGGIGYGIDRARQK